MWCKLKCDSVSVSLVVAVEVAHSSCWQSPDGADRQSRAGRRRRRIRRCALWLLWFVSLLLVQKAMWTCMVLIFFNSWLKGNQIHLVTASSSTASKHWAHWARPTRLGTAHHSMVHTGPTGSTTHLVRFPDYHSPHWAHLAIRHTRHFWAQCFADY